MSASHLGAAGPWQKRRCLRHRRPLQSFLATFVGAPLLLSSTPRMRDINIIPAAVTSSQARDLRLLDAQPSSSPPAILAREKAIIVNLEFLKCIITTGGSCYWAAVVTSAFREVMGSCR